MMNLQKAIVENSFLFCVIRVGDITIMNKGNGGGAEEISFNAGFCERVLRNISRS